MFTKGFVIVGMHLVSIGDHLFIPPFTVRIGTSNSFLISIRFRTVSIYVIRILMAVDHIIGDIIRI